MKLLFMTDSVDEMVAHLKTHAIKKFGLVKKPLKAHWFYVELIPPKKLAK